MFKGMHGCSSSSCCMFMGGCMAVVVAGTLAGTLQDCRGGLAGRELSLAMLEVEEKQRLSGKAQRWTCLRVETPRQLQWHRWSV